MTSLSAEGLDPLRYGFPTMSNEEGVAEAGQVEKLKVAYEAYLGAADAEERDAAGEDLIRVVFGNDAIGDMKT